MLFVRWSYLNIAIELRIEVDAYLEGKIFPLSRIRAYSGAANQLRADNWQPLAITVMALVPVPDLPKRLHTAFCWSDAYQFVDDTAKGLSSITTWKALVRTKVILGSIKRRSGLDQSSAETLF